MRTKITELLQIEYPIFQGGMAWVAEHKLAAAVSNAGGFGIIGAASAPPEVVREEIRKCKELTDKPFGVNIMLLNPNAEEVAKIVVEEGVQAVTTGAGNPGKFMELWKNAGVKVIPVVASVAMAKMMERAGADAVVAEGMESGGHIGSTTTMALVPQVVDAVSIPVIAAGGIADGRGMAAAFMLGAEGIQMGTRFVASKESIVHENYKNQIIKAKDIDSVVTGMSTGHPVRSLRNQMTREYLKLEKENADFMELEKLTLGSLRKAVQDGDTVNGTLMAGQIAGLIRREQTCRNQRRCLLAVDLHRIYLERIPVDAKHNANLYLLAGIRAVSLKIDSLLRTFLVRLPLGRAKEIIERIAYRNRCAILRQIRITHLCRIVQCRRQHSHRICRCSDNQHYADY